MSERNVATLKRIYDLIPSNWAREGAPDDWSGLTELWDPEVVVEENAAFPDKDSYRGYEGLLRWWTAFFEIYEEIRIEPREFLPAGDRVLVHAHHWLHSKMGVVLEQDVNHLWTLRDGRVVHVTGYMDRTEALEALDR